MMDKIEMQTAGMERSQEALDRERKLNDLRLTLDKSGVSPTAQAQILDLQQRNDMLTTEVAIATDKLKKMKAFIKNQDALFRAEEQKRVSVQVYTLYSQQLSATTSETQRTYESTIATLKNELSVAKVRSYEYFSRLTAAQRAVSRLAIPARTTAHARRLARARRPRRPRPRGSRWYPSSRRGPTSVRFLAGPPAETPGRRPLREVTAWHFRGRARRGLCARTPRSMAGHLGPRAPMPSLTSLQPTTTTYTRTKRAP